MRHKLIIAAMAALIGVIYLAGSTSIRTVRLGDPLGPKVFPILLGVGMLLACAMLLIESRAAPAPEPAAAEPAPSGHVLVIAGTIVWTALYFWSFEPVGYVAATTLYLFGLMYVFNGRAWISSGLIAILFSCVSYLLFTRLLGVRLPAGLLPF